MSYDEKVMDEYIKDLSEYEQKLPGMREALSKTVGFAIFNARFHLVEAIKAEVKRVNDLCLGIKPD